MNAPKISSFKTVLISTYEMGRQPFGLASPAAWLKNENFDVTLADISVEPFPEQTIRKANLVAFYVPMHTATRLAIPLISRVHEINAQAHICFYGLYAPITKSYLQQLGVQTVLGGEFEAGLLQLVKRLSRNGYHSDQNNQFEPLISLSKQQFRKPFRSGLPNLSEYAQLYSGNSRPKKIGYVEASRGCKHSCRHCPIVPVYNGQFRIVQSEIVLDDIRQQVEAGAKHITFGDPDFFNGPGHSIPIVKALHKEFPEISYDVTIKIEHLLKHQELLSVLKETGCAIVTSAVESIDERVLKIFNKGHTKQDFIDVSKLFTKIGLVLNPTFVTFTPWTTLENYRDLLLLLSELNLFENVSPIQLGIRLLIPPGSKLLELSEVQKVIGNYNQELLSYEWENPDPLVEIFYQEVFNLVKNSDFSISTRLKIVKIIWKKLNEITGKEESLVDFSELKPRSTIPYLNESWYC